MLTKLEVWSTLRLPIFSEIGGLPVKEDLGHHLITIRPEKAITLHAEMTSKLDVQYMILQKHPADLKPHDRSLPRTKMTVKSTHVR